MKRILLILFLFATSLSAEQFQDTVHKTFPASPGGLLKLEVEFGDIELTTVDSNQVEMDVLRRVTAGNKEEAQSIFDDLDIQSQQKGNTIEVQGTFKEGWRHWSSWGNGRICHNGHCLSYGDQLRELRYRIHVPKNFNINVDTSGGDVIVGDLQGDSRVSTSGGDIRVGHITGKIDVNTSGGDVRVVQGDRNANIETSGGDINVGEIAGDVVARTSGGDIEIKKGNNVDVETSGGDIRISAANGHIQAETSGGEIEVHLMTQPKDESRLESSAGNVLVYLPSSVKLNLDARTNMGEVNAGSISLSSVIRKEDELQGSLNGGGPNLVVRTSTGDIEIRTNH
ncbi:MAG: hypothetical protein C5B54_09405 [Acidobacteria bacterium]|nr:MAG: hypothetical protein C5B54_09405 [Acidobacteriota bacterium]